MENKSIKTRTKIVPLTANNLTKAIVNFIINEGGHATRINTTGIYDPKRNVFRKNNSRGIADIIACINGKYIAIEVKIGKDKQSKYQIDFEAKIKSSGGKYWKVSSMNEFFANHYYNCFGVC